MKKIWVYLYALTSLLPGSKTAEAAPNKTCAPERRPASWPKDLRPEEAQRLIEQQRENGQGLIILDVRTPEEYTDGRIRTAKNINYFDPRFQQLLAKLDKSTPCLVHCASGRRSAKARDILTKLGFSTIYHLEGGLKAWRQAGYPVER